MIKPVFVVFVRHANNHEYMPEEPKYPGPGLTKKGKVEAKKTCEFLKGFGFDRIYCSDMTRAIETAEEIKKHHHCKVSYHRALAEINQAIFNLSFAKGPVEPSKIKTNIKRAKEGRKFFKQMLKENQGRKVLIVGHGNAISSLIGYGLGRTIQDTPRLSLKNCSISAAMFNKGKISLISHIGLMDHIKRAKYSNVVNEPELNKLLNLKT